MFKVCMLTCLLSDIPSLIRPRTYSEANVAVSIHTKVSISSWMQVGVELMSMKRYFFHPPSRCTWSYSTNLHIEKTRFQFSQLALPSLVTRKSHDQEACIDLETSCRATVGFQISHRRNLRILRTSTFRCIVGDEGFVSRWMCSFVLSRLL